MNRLIFQYLYIILIISALYPENESIKTLNKEKEIIGFAIIMPSYSKALQKMKGKLFPFGFFHLMKAKKYSKNLTLYLIGVHPEYQNKGVTAILFSSLLQNLKGKEIEDCFRTPELIENDAIDKIWKNFNPVLRKKRCTYKKIIE